MIFRFKNSMDFFNTLDEALEVAENAGVPKSDIICLTNEEYEQLFEASEVPDESTSMTPVEFVRKTTTDKGLEPKRYNSQSKQYAETLTTKNYVKEYILRGFESLADSNISSCPFCQRDWTFIKEELSNKPETLSFRTQNKEFESPELQIRETHLFYQHKPIAKLLYKLGIIQQFVDLDGHLHPTNSKNSQNLTKEQLALKKEDLKKSLYSHWIESKQR